MNIDRITPSTLKIVAKANLHIEDDLTKTQAKSLEELIDEQKETGQPQATAETTDQEETSTEEAEEDTPSS